MNVQNALSVGAIPVSDRFIDEYMPQANGDYVKVYLWLLRNAAREVTLSEAAGALMLTEGESFEKFKGVSDIKGWLMKK